MTNANLFFPDDNQSSRSASNKIKASPDQIRDAVRKNFADAICQAVADKHLTHSEAAAIAQTPRTSLTAILNGKLERVSLDRLLNIVTRLGASVHVRITLPNSPSF